MSKTCCGGLEEMEKRGIPFNRPMMVDLEAGKMTFPWAIWLPKLTPAGNISKKGSINIFLNFCPFCGADIRTEEPKNEKDKELVGPAQPE